MSDVSISLTYLLQTAFVGLLGIIWYFVRQELARFDHRLDKLENNYDHVLVQIDKRMSELKEIVYELKVQLVTNHPTKEEVRKAFEYITDKRKQESHDKD